MDDAVQCKHSHSVTIDGIYSSNKYIYFCTVEDVWFSKALATIAYLVQPT
jgi:hypothetical protein